MDLATILRLERLKEENAESTAKDEVCNNEKRAAWAQYDFSLNLNSVLGFFQIQIVATTMM